MTPDGIASLITAILALLFSIFNLIVLLCFEKKKSHSEYREHFFDSVIKSDKLIDITKLISSLKADVSPSNFTLLHFACVEYKKEIGYISLVQPLFYNKINLAVTQIDDLSIECCQMLHDKFVCEDQISLMLKNVNVIYRAFEAFYQGNKIKKDKWL